MPKNAQHNFKPITHEIQNANGPDSISFAQCSRNHYNYISSLPQSFNNTMNFNNINSFSDRQRQ
jgi:hypothetical protein